MASGEGARDRHDCKGVVAYGHDTLSEKDACQWGKQWPCVHGGINVGGFS